MRNSSTVSPIVRFMQFSLVVGVCVLAWVPAYAELQNVEVGGEIRLRGRFWRHTYAASFSSAPVQPFSGDFWGRTLGPWGFGSRFDWDDRGGDLRYWEQKTKLHVRADFTNDVSAAISIEACDIWGEDFRSEYVTGTDVRQAGSQTMEVSQGYIQANDMWDTPLDLRIGRQFIKLGKGWLVGDVISGTIPLFFDGVRATYDTDSFVVDAWWAKLDENSPAEEDGDEDFYGVAATYTGWDAFDLSAYWLWVRDAREVHDTEDGLIAEGLEEILGLDQYGDSNLHTLGVRLNGQEQSWDYDWELAYQFGDAAQRGRLFAPLMYGDDDAKNSGWATDLEVGYTFDVKWKPRVFVGGAYLSGSDDREFAPWGGHSSDAFHRMFSSLLYSLVLDVGQDMTNFNQIRVGVDARFTEKLSGHLQLAYFQVNDTTDLPLRYSFWGNTHALFPNWPFLTEESDSSLGTQAYGFLKYNYTEDFWVMLAWEHFFTDDGLTDGNFIYRNGLQFSGGTDTKDGDYITIDMGLKF